MNIFITQCTKSTLIRNPFTFIEDSYNHETLLETKTLEKLEIQLAKSRTARFFNLRCLANKVPPKPCKSNGKAINLNRP